jgi:hypothetical protein
MVQVPDITGPHEGTKGCPINYRDLEFYEFARQERRVRVCGFLSECWPGKNSHLANTKG